MSGKPLKQSRRVGTETGMSTRRYQVVNWFLAWLLLTGAITVWRWEIVDSPPYWDSAMGLFLEADFLTETHFDYRRLIFEEKRFLEGGKGVYLNSVLPTFVAVLMTYLPSPSHVFVAYHLFSFGCAAAIALVMYSILAPRCGQAITLLATAALLTTPVFAVQIDMLGMDLPLLVVAMIAAKLLFDGRYVTGALLTFASFFVKSTGQALTAATVIYLGLLLLLRWQNLQTRRELWLGLGTSLFALALEIQVSTSIQSLPTSEHERFEPNLWIGLEILKNLWAWCPDIVVLFVVTLAMWGVAISRRMVGYYNTLPDTGDRLTRLIQAGHAVIWEHRTALFSWIVVFGMLLAFALIYTIPRYLVLPLAFLIFVLATTLASRRSWRLFAYGAFAALIAFNVLNLDGRFLQPLGKSDTFDQRTGALLERSREYLEDHRANLLLVQSLSRGYRDWSIVAPNPFVHFLSLPRLGYVKEPLQGYSISVFTTPTFPKLTQLEKDPFRYLLFLWVPNRFMGLAMASHVVDGKSVPAPQIPFPDGRPEMRLVFQDDKHGPLRAFYRLWPASLAQEDVRNHYLVELFGGEGFLAIAKQAYESGHVQEALTVYQKALEADPKNVEAMAQAATMRYLLGETQTAVLEYQRALQLDPDHPTALNGLGVVLAETGKLAAAKDHFQKAVEVLTQQEKPEKKALAEAYRNWGLAYWREKNLAAAVERLEMALQRDSDFAAAHRDLGQIHLELGDLTRAHAELLLATKLYNQDTAAWISLGIVEAQLGNPDAALRALDYAVAITPRNPILLFRRGTILEDLLGLSDRAEADYSAAIAGGVHKNGQELLGTMYLRRGNIRLRRGEVSAAREDFRLALATDPRAAAAANNLAWILATHAEESQRDSAEAMRLARLACDLTARQRPDFLDTLAAAYASDGKWEDAIRTIESGIELSKAGGHKELAEAMEGRRQQYLQRQPYRQERKKGNG